MRPKDFPRLHGRDHRNDGRDPIPVAIAFEKVGSEAGAGAGLTIADEGTPLPNQPTLNFTGPGVTTTDDPATHRTDVTITGGGSGGTALQIADEGSVLPTEPTLNFTGAGVTATTDTVNNRTDVTIPGASGGTSGVFFETDPQTGDYLVIQTTGSHVHSGDPASGWNAGINLLAGGTGGLNLSVINDNTMILTTAGNGGILLEASANGWIHIDISSSSSKDFQIAGLPGPTTKPAGGNVVWRDSAGYLRIG